MGNKKTDVTPEEAAKKKIQKGGHGIGRKNRLANYKAMNRLGTNKDREKKRQAKKALKKDRHMERRKKLVKVAVTAAGITYIAWRILLL